MVRRLNVPFPSLRFLAKCFAAMGIFFLCCVFGAAMMHFNWGPAKVLRKAFIGIEAYQQRGHQTPSSGSRVQSAFVSDNNPGRTQDGFTLYTTTEGCNSKLIDMQGTVVHEWHLPFSQVWSDPPHIENPLSDDKLYWFRSRLFPNGDLLALYYTDSDTPHGYGLVKMDKDSRIIWKYANTTHHDFDVDANGVIYVLTQHITHDLPGRNSALVDSVAVLSPEGQQLHEISLIDALSNSPYALMLDSLGQSLDMPHHPPSPRSVRASGPRAPGQPTGPAPNIRENGDLTHANSVAVLSDRIASKFPFLKAGQLLISLRNADALMVLDIESKRVVWAAKGFWHLQHNAEFLDNGHLLIFDNEGSLKGARVLEFDPANNSYPWAYPGETGTPFLAAIRGMKQRLSSGNTLIADPDGGRIFEVTLDKELVWEYRCSNVIASFTRYPAETLSFLPANVNPRPK